MSNPLYQVGEEVILHSQDLPQYNGEYKVNLVINPKSHHIDTNGRICYNNSDGFSYTLDEVFLNAHGNQICWQECALRKKHKPSEFGSYDQLMKNLKIGEKV